MYSRLFTPKAAQLAKQIGSGVGCAAGYTTIIAAQATFNIWMENSPTINTIRKHLRAGDAIKTATDQTSKYCHRFIK